MAIGGSIHSHNFGPRDGCFQIMVFLPSYGRVHHQYTFMKKASEVDTNSQIYPNMRHMLEIYWIIIAGVVKYRLHISTGLPVTPQFDHILFKRDRLAQQIIDIFVT